ncbi:MAG TPA: glycerol-3-phosphate dehydrogenase [Gammaproteobacteria bacterium]|nr:glycerol-3-phosphate dehydrogenase [Gammaproteobacteria bacterium]
MDIKFVDLLILGGGINGTGIAADAAGRGLHVVLCDKKDLGSGTSSASSKLIHGGLRYLEHYALKFVKRSLREREILLHSAPHLIHPIPFILPHNPKLRNFWVVRLGLFLYDILKAPSRLPFSTLVRFDHRQKNHPLSRSYARGFQYYDCMADDSRLVIANALRAKDHGAHIMPYTEVLQIERKPAWWRILLRKDGTTFEVHAKACVNATGPWALETLHKLFLLSSSVQIKLIKGSHIIVPKLYEEDVAYLLQNKDARIIFVLPFQKQFSLIGTTDIVVDSPNQENTSSLEEIEYLCQCVSSYFHHPIKISDVIHSFCGIRTLVGTQNNPPASLSREHHLELHSESPDSPPLLTIFGGKITTFRILAEEALEVLSPYLPTMGKPWTRNSILPGGLIGKHSMDSFIETVKQSFPFLPFSLVERYAHAYGSSLKNVLANVRSMNDLGEHFGHGLYEVEVKYLLDQEWATHADDILWRRTKLGLLFSPHEIQRLNQKISFYLSTKMHDKMVI